jgi:hypothetical protein
MKEDFFIKGGAGRVEGFNDADENGVTVIKKTFFSVVDVAQIIEGFVLQKFFGSVCSNDRGNVSYSALKRYPLGEHYTHQKAYGDSDICVQVGILNYPGG